MAYGWLVAGTGRYARMLRDFGRGRRPAGFVAITLPFAVIAIVALASIYSPSHLWIATLAVVSVVLIAGLVGAVTYPFRRLWTNAYWRIPPPSEITAHDIQVFGRVYVVIGAALIVACIGGLIGLIPKLVYVGTGFTPAMFAVAEIVALIIAVVVAVKGWRLFQSVQVRSRKLD